MVNFFRSVADFFSSVWSMITNFCSSMIQAIQLLVEVPISAFKVIPFVPAIIGSCISIVIAIGIIKLILGWGNQ